MAKNGQKRGPKKGSKIAKKGGPKFVYPVFFSSLFEDPIFRNWHSPGELPGYPKNTVTVKILKIDDFEGILQGSDPTGPALGRANFK